MNVSLSKMPLWRILIYEAAHAYQFDLWLKSIRIIALLRNWINSSMLFQSITILYNFLIRSGLQNKERIIKGPLMKAALLYSQILFENSLSKICHSSQSSNIIVVLRQKKISIYLHYEAWSMNKRHESFSLKIIPLESKNYTQLHIYG